MGYLPKTLHLSEPQFSPLKNNDNNGPDLKELFCESNEEKKDYNLCDSAWHIVVFPSLYSSTILSGWTPIHPSKPSSKILFHFSALLISCHLLSGSVHIVMGAFQRFFGAKFPPSQEPSNGSSAPLISPTHCSQANHTHSLGLKAPDFTLKAVKMLKTPEALCQWRLYSVYLVPVCLPLWNVNSTGQGLCVFVYFCHLGSGVQRTLSRHLLNGPPLARILPSLP